MGTSKINILFLADPNSIHDIKWISYFEENTDFGTFILSRKVHYNNEVLKNDDFKLQKTIPVGSIEDFSVVRFYRTIFSAIKLKRLIRKYKINLVHILYAEPNALWCNFRDYLGVPMIITCRGTDVLITIPEAFKKKSLVNYLVAPAYRMAFKKADWVSGTSLSQLKSIENFSHRSNNLSVIRTGVDIELIQRNTDTYFPLNDSQPFILFPRYIKPVYNHELALRAISLLPLPLKNNYKFVFVGKDSGDNDYQRKLEDIIKNLGEVKIEFIRKQTQKALFELYKKASLVIMVPKSDGSPVSAMEALICESKLILGPLEYDADIFSDNVIKMETWEPQELMEKITNMLQTSFKPLPERVKLLIDRKTNMDNVTTIYNSFAEKRS